MDTIKTRQPARKTRAAINSRILELVIIKKTAETIKTIQPIKCISRAFIKSSLYSVIV